MKENQGEWVKTKDRLVTAVTELGFLKELGEEIAKNLGSIKAMERMIAYLDYVKPKKAEMIVDEMLAICEEISDWREKKESREANARYNDIRYRGLIDE